MVLLRNQLEGLRELGCETIILAEASRHNTALDAKEYKVYQLPPAYPKFSGVLSHVVTHLFPELFPIDTIYHAAHLILKEQMDVVVGTGSIFSSLWTAILGHLTHKPTIHQISLGTVIGRRRWWAADVIKGYKVPYHFYPQFIRDFVEQALREIPKRGLGIKSLLNRITRIVVNSNFSKRELIDRFGLSEDKIDVIYPIVKLPTSNEARNEENPVVAYFGHLRAGRGAHDVIKAFKIIRTFHPETMLVMASSEIHEPTYLYCTRLVNDFGLKSNVIWRGVLADIHSDLLNPSTVIVLPYRDTPSIKLIEAMAAAKPVITTRLDWTPEFISDRNNGFLVNPGDTNAIANKADAIISDKQLARRMGRKAREHVANKCSVRKNSKLFMSALMRASQVK